MKYFILVAVIFFCFRAFSQTFDYYYIDEYIRATEDPEYADYLNQKRAEARVDQRAVDEFKEEKAYDEFVQEQARLAFVEEKAKVKSEDFSKQEQEYEKQKQKDYKQFLMEQEQYAAWKASGGDKKWLRENPERMIASLPKYEKVPRKDRKFKFKAPQNKKR